MVEGEPTLEELVTERIVQWRRASDGVTIEPLFE